MAEYTTDELAEDSDDEKRIEKAEKAAKLKATKRRRKQAGKLAGRLRTTSSRTAAATPLAAPPLLQPTTRRPSMATGAMPRSGPVGPCFACGEMGHLRLHCPKVASTVEGGSRKSYPFGTRAVGVDDSFHLNIYCDCAKSVGQPDLHPKQPDKIDIVGDGCVHVTKEVSPVGVLGSQRC